jgi:RNA polymerase sigma-70 factor (ECF subfamily)
MSSGVDEVGGQKGGSAQLATAARARPLSESQTQEAELVLRAQRGDVDAYEQLVRAYEQLAFRTAFVITRSAADAEDAVQDAFFKAYRSLPRFRTHLPLRPWLLQIVSNEARNRRRSAQRRDALTFRFASAEAMRTPTNPEAVAEASAEQRELLRHVNAMEENDRLVIACRYFLDLDTEETSAALGVPIGTVKSRLSRALERLRSSLGAAGA